ncbi:hypothetical protein NMG60_11003388 [Bertholletia excelsa]
MDSSERLHRTTSTGELFICFTSRLSSSSSMKLSSKSILSPARTRDGPASLPASLSRRLRTNGSLKGGQSPMFPTVGKKRGCTFENPEPSSPKVTCIGQVRVKTKKKQGQKMRTLSKRRDCESFRRFNPIRDELGSNLTRDVQSGSNGECLPQRSGQRWVHLPLTICEALRAFGAEFSCLFPCRSSCFSSGERGKEEDKPARSGQEINGHGGSCVAVFARWLVALQEGEERDERREVEIQEKRDMGLRRRVEEDHIQIRDEKCELKEEDGERRPSICVPPKNALLLMRCRSDPMRMAALASRSWESFVFKDGEEEEDEEEEEGAGEGHGSYEDVEGEEAKVNTRLTDDDNEGVEMPEALFSAESYEEEENPGPEAIHFGMEKLDPEVENPEEEKPLIDEERLEEDEERHDSGVQEEINLAAETEENELMVSVSEALGDLENLDNKEAPRLVVEEEEEERRIGRESTSEASVQSNAEYEVVVEAEAEKSKEEETETRERSESEDKEQENHGHETADTESETKKLDRENDGGRPPVLPDCLLLMMCEPKLSMEVSKETWVCSADFIRWLPERCRPVAGPDDAKKRINNTTDSNPAHNQLQPPRSSCSLPAPAPAMTMAAMIEQKLVNAVAYEPFVLTRCKSEPMRTAAAKLAPEKCFWKNRKLHEPHRRATFGFRTAGVGF